MRQIARALESWLEGSDLDERERAVPAFGVVDHLVGRAAGMAFPVSARPLDREDFNEW
jgi:hypothetical protein